MFHPIFPGISSRLQLPLPSFRGALGGCASLVGCLLKSQITSMYEKHLPFQLPSFLPMAILHNPDFKISGSVTSFFIHKSLHTLEFPPIFLVVQANVLHSTNCRYCLEYYYFLYGKKAVLINVNRAISLYFSSPVWRSLLLDFSCTNTGNTPVGKYTAVFAQSLLF